MGRGQSGGFRRWAVVEAVLAAAALLTAADAGTLRLAEALMQWALTAWTFAPEQHAVLTMALADLLVLPVEVLVESAVLLVALRSLLEGASRRSVASAYLRVLAAYGAFSVALYVGSIVLFPALVVLLLAVILGDPYPLVDPRARWQLPRGGPLPMLALVALLLANLPGTMFLSLAQLQLDPIPGHLLGLGQHILWAATLVAFAWAHRHRRAP
jgi:hypothetical protein